MLNLVKPRYVMPFHGDFKRMRLHAQLAEAVGHRPRGHLPGRERAAARDRRGAARASATREQSGMIFVDGVEIGDMADVALRDRRMLSADGIFIVVATIAEQDGESVAPTRGDLPRRARSSTRPTSWSRRSATTVERSLARAAERGDPRDRPAPAGAARRSRGVRLRPPASAARWCCRSSSRSEPRRQSRRGRRRRRAACASADWPAGSGPRTGRRCRRPVARARPMPPWDSATARTIARPEAGAAARRRRRRARSARTASAAQLRRDPGPVVLDDQHRVAVRGARRGADVGARRACGAARSRSG